MYVRKSGLFGEALVATSAAKQASKAARLKLTAFAGLLFSVTKLRLS